jgi:hypothetical protein
MVGGGTIPLPIGERVDRAQPETGEGVPTASPGLAQTFPSSGAPRHLLPNGEKNRRPNVSDHQSHSPGL